MGFQMFATIARLIVPLSVAAFSGNGCAVNSPPPHNIQCRVIGGEKLPAASGGSDALCAAISRAAEAGFPGKSFSVEVRVQGSSTLRATLTTSDGTVLPERRYSVSDQSLSKESFDRFAKALIGAAAPRLAR